MHSLYPTLVIITSVALSVCNQAIRRLDSVSEPLLYSSMWPHAQLRSSALPPHPPSVHPLDRPASPSHAKALQETYLLIAPFSIFISFLNDVTYSTHRASGDCEAFTTAFTQSLPRCFSPLTPSRLPSVSAFLRRPLNCVPVLPSHR